MSKTAIVVVNWLNNSEFIHFFAARKNEIQFLFGVRKAPHSTQGTFPNETRTEKTSSDNFPFRIIRQSDLDLSFSYRVFKTTQTLRSEVQTIFWHGFVEKGHTRNNLWCSALWDCGLSVFEYVSGFTQIRTSIV